MSQLFALEIVEGPPLAHDIPAMTVPQFIRERARENPDSIALIDSPTERSVTYRELDRLIGRCAAGFAAIGLKPGDTLLMFAPNMPEWPIVALGAMAAGGIVSGANPAYSASDLAHQMREAKARFAFTIASLLATVREAAMQAGCETIVLLGEAEGTVSYASLLACEDPEPDVAQDPDAPVALPFSSGTTGIAKGVILTHRTLVSNVAQYREALPMSGTSRVALAVLPMYHIFGFTVITLCGLASGATLVTMPRFEPEAFLKTIERYRVSHLAVVPPLMQFLATHPMVDNYDLSSLEQIGCGAAPLGEAFEERVAERLDCTVGQGFGMTESSGVVATLPREGIRRGSSGRLLPATQGRVVDPETRRRSAARRCGRALVSRTASVQRISESARGDRRVPSRPTVGCAPVTSVTSTRTAIFTSPIVSRN